MALILDKSTISTLGIITPGQVSQSVDAFTGEHEYDITISGSLTVTGSVDITDVINIGNAGYINGLPILTSATITGVVTSVNGVFPVNGNVTTALTAVITGTSASLAVSSSGTITGSIGEGTVWVVAGDPNPNNNGDSYIFASGPPGIWYPIAPLDVAAADSRYILKDGDDSHTGSLYISGSNISIDLLGSTRIEVVNDLSNNTSLDPNTRELVNSSGDIVVDWENGIFTGSLYGTASYALESEPIKVNANATIYSSTPPSTTYPANTSIFLGSNAGSGSVSPDNSIFLGTNSGRQANLSTNSNFIGQTTGFQATSASFSNFIGFQSGYQATSASYSTFIGADAGYSASNASHSILIGTRAGLRYTGNNIGSNNIIIGTNISLPNNARNSINIGGVIYATGSYSNIVGNPSILGQSNARVGIATFSPEETLHVAGNVRSINNVVAVQSAATTPNYSIDADQYASALWTISTPGTCSFSNLSNGQSATVYIRNSSASSLSIAIQASTGFSSYVTASLSRGNNTTRISTVTVPATTGQVTVQVINIGGSFVGSVG